MKKYYLRYSSDSEKIENLVEHFFKQRLGYDEVLDMKIVLPSKGYYSYDDGALTPSLLRQFQIELKVFSSQTKEGNKLGLKRLDELIWVTKQFSGPPQCTNHADPNRYAPLGPINYCTKEKQLGLKFFTRNYQSNATCSACEMCPSYAITGQYLIKQEDLKKWANLGFYQK